MGGEKDAPAEMPGEREIRIVGDIAYVPLTKGLTAVISAADAPTISGYRWYATPRGRTVYAARTDCRGGRPSIVYMHRAVLNAPRGMHADHINGDGLDNRRANLRLATVAQNTWNQRLSRKNTSGFKGVRWHKVTRTWRAEIQVDGRKKHLGCFSDPESAYAAYCEAARKIHGRYARVS